MASLSYADTLERTPATIWQRILGRPGTLTPRAQAKLARRERDDAYRAAARGQRALRCVNCGGTQLDVPIVRGAPSWRLRGGRLEFRRSNVPMNLVRVGSAEYRHADRRACAATRSLVRKSIWQRIASLFTR